MGEIKVQAEIENTVDRVVCERGLGEESEVRTHTVEATVATGSVMMVLPQDVVEKLGLETRRHVIVTYADERREERPVAGPLTVKIGDRFMNTDCVVGPPASEPLVGQVIMEELDLVADGANRTLTPRPESPIYPLLNLK